MTQNHGRTLSKQLAVLVTTAVAAANLPAAHAIPGGRGTEPPIAELLKTPASILSKSEGSQNGSEQLKLMIEHLKGVDGYVFESTLTTYPGGKAYQETGKFYFKSPNLIRYEVLKSRDHAGAVVVRQRDGKIRGKMGGLLGAIKVTLSPDSKMLKAPNGISIMKSDLVSLLSDARKRVSVDVNCLTGKVPVPGSGEKAQIIELVESDGDMEDRIAMDLKDKAPSSWSIFTTGSKLVSVAAFNNLQIRTDLDDSLFSFDDKDQKELGPQTYEGSSKMAAATENSAMTEETLNEANHILNLLKARVTELRNHSPIADGGTSWISGGEQRLLVKSAEMELMVNDLRNISKSVEAIETSEAEGANAREWAKSLDNCVEHLAKLIDMAHTTPSEQEYISLLDNIFQETNTLSSIVNPKK